MVETPCRTALTDRLLAGPKVHREARHTREARSRCQDVRLRVNLGSLDSEREQQLWRRDVDLPAPVASPLRAIQLSIRRFESDELRVESLGDLLSPRGELRRSRGCCFVMTDPDKLALGVAMHDLSLIHISEPTRPY